MLGFVSSLSTAPEIVCECVLPVCLMVRLCVCVLVCVCIVVTGVIVSVFVILVVLLIWNVYVSVIVGGWVNVAG